MNRRQYKKLYKICHDDNGKVIYWGDTVEVYFPQEMRTTWQSTVHWNMLDGAFINSHPGHQKMGLSTHRNLRDFLNQTSIPFYDGDNEIVKHEKGYLKKVKSIR